MGACCSPTSSPPPRRSPPPGRARPRWPRSPRCSPSPSPDEVETVTAYVGGALRQRRTGLGWRGLSSLPAAGVGSPSLTVAEVHEAFEPTRGAVGVRVAGGARGGGGRPLRAGDRRRAGLAARGRHRRRPPGRARLARAGGAGRRGRGAAGRRTPGRDAGRLDGGGRAGGVRRASTRWPRSGSRSGGRCCRCSPPARPTVGRRAGEGRRRRRGRGRREARRHPDPGAPLRRRRARRDPLARGHHRPAARGGRGGAVAAGDVVRARRRGAGARRRRPAAALPGDGVAHRDGRRASRVTPYFFDVLHLDGVDLLDSPASERAAALERLVPAEHRVPRLVTAVAPRRRGLPRRDPRLRPRGRRREVADRAVRRRPPRRRPGSR